MKVRFAPSPTGYLHIGNARVAILNYLLAKSKGGQFMLRLDDTDQERSKEEYAKAIEEDLHYLGITWDLFEKQSDRMDVYKKALEKLKEKGRLYACYETKEELDLKRKIQLGQGKAPVYDREALSLTEEEIKERYQDRKPYYRFKLLDEAVSWHDAGKGDVFFEAGHLSDPVLIRADGYPLYTLTSVVDDGDFSITHIVRGEDHVSNTAVQIQLFEALGYDVPSFAHMPLLTSAEGKLSKRTGSLGLRDLKEAGIEARSIFAYLAKLGTSFTADGSETFEGLCQDFSLEKFGKAQPKFDLGEIEHLNAKVLGHMSYEEALPRLKNEGLPLVEEAFWEVIHGNLEKLKDVQYWYDVCYHDFVGEVADADRSFLKEAGKLLPEKPTVEDYKPWIEACKNIDGRKGKGLFLPLRVALTGRDHGPELKDLIPFMEGRAKARLLLL